MLPNEAPRGLLIGAILVAAVLSLNIALGRAETPAQRQTANIVLYAMGGALALTLPFFCRTFQAVTDRRELGVLVGTLSLCLVFTGYFAVLLINSDNLCLWCPKCGCEGVSGQILLNFLAAAAPVAVVALFLLLIRLR